MLGQARESGNEKTDCDGVQAPIYAKAIVCLRLYGTCAARLLEPNPG